MTEPAIGDTRVAVGLLHRAGIAMRAGERESVADAYGEARRLTEKLRTGALRDVEPATPLRLLRWCDWRGLPGVPFSRPDEDGAVSGC